MLQTTLQKPALRLGGASFRLGTLRRRPSHTRSRLQEAHATTTCTTSSVFTHLSLHSALWQLCWCWKRKQKRQTASSHPLHPSCFFCTPHHWHCPTARPDLGPTRDHHHPAHQGRQVHTTGQQLAHVTASLCATALVRHTSHQPTQSQRGDIP